MDSSDIVLTKLNTFNYIKMCRGNDNGIWGFKFHLLFWYVLVLIDSQEFGGFWGGVWTIKFETWMEFLCGIFNYMEDTRFKSKWQKFS